MSRNRNRKNRAFQIESLERREMMSATPWTQESAEPSVSAAVSSPNAGVANTSGVQRATIYDTKLNPDGPFTGTHGNRVAISFQNVTKNDESPFTLRFVDRGSYKSLGGGNVIMDLSNGRFIYEHPTDHEYLKARHVYKDSFTYLMTYTDALGKERTAAGTVHVEILNNPNLIPDAVTDRMTVAKNDPTFVNNGFFTRNDTDPEGANVTFKNAYGGPDTIGSIRVSSAGVSYTPKPGFTGNDRFYYEIKDADGRIDVGVVEVKVADVVAFDDGYKASPGETIAIALLDNDKGEPRRVTNILNLPSGIALTPHGPEGSGKYLLTVSADASGPQTFQYEIVGLDKIPAYAAVTISVPVPEKPYVPPFTASIDRDGVLTIQANEPREFEVSQQGNHLIVSTKEKAGGLIFKGFTLGSVKAIVFYGTSGNDGFVNNTNITSTVYGGDGHDTLLGGSGADMLYGQGGNDMVQGRGGNDQVEGGGGNDKLYGGGGNDRLIARDGTLNNDFIDGGNGNNSVVDDVIVDPVPEAQLKNGRLVIQGNQNANNVSVGLAGKEVVVTWGSRQKRFAVASVKAIEFRGGQGNDAFANNTSIAAEAYGDEGNDKLLGGSGKDVLRGGVGNDWLEGRGGNDALHGDDGNDTIQGGVGDDQLFGGNHHDHLDGGAGNDRLEGGAGNDGMYGGDGRDFLFGQEGTDWLYGGFGNDELYGGLGNDNLDGEAGDDSLYGEQGNDRLRSRDASVGNDRLFGGLGVNVFDAPKVEIKQK